MELFRFRNVRPIQSQPCDGIDITTLYKPALTEEELKQATGAVAGQPPTAAVAVVLAWLQSLSCDLAMRSPQGGRRPPRLPGAVFGTTQANWSAAQASVPMAGGFRVGRRL